MVRRPRRPQTVRRVAPSRKSPCTASAGRGGAVSVSSIVSFLAAHWLEAAGMLATVIGIWLTTRRLLICWPVVLVADLLYLVVFYRSQLYSDALLQLFFVAFTLYGWWHWWRGVRTEGEVRVEPLSFA